MNLETEYRKFITYSIIILIMTFTVYSLYSLFNPKVDSDFEKKIKEQNEAVIIKFDEKSLEEIRNLSLRSEKPILVNEIRNPFMPY